MMIKLIFKIILILVLVYLFGGLAFSIFGKVFGWISDFCYWIANWLDKLGFEPLINIGGGG